METKYYSTLISTLFVGIQTFMVIDVRNRPTAPLRFINVIESAVLGLAGTPIESHLLNPTHKVTFIPLKVGIFIIVNCSCATCLPNS
jgi:hypothetical protein